MSDIAILKQMIKEESTVSLEECQNGRRLNYSVTLTEAKANYFVKIDGMPKHEDVIVINPEFFNPSTVFKASKGECKRADFVIIADDHLGKIIVCIEMKKTKGENKKIIQQLKGAKCFIAYCQEIGHSFWQDENFLKNYEYRFVSIKNISVPKTITRRDKQTSKPTEINDRPDRMLRISSPSGLQFNQLVEGHKG